MAKAYVCDACGELMVGKRNMVKVLEVDGTEAHDTKTLKSFDMHLGCVEKLVAIVKNGASKP